MDDTNVFHRRVARLLKLVFGSGRVSLLVGVLFGFAVQPTARGNDGPLSSTDQLITVSLVPDGTWVGNVRSSLSSTVARRIGGDATLKLQVARACQRWSTPTNLNFSFVSDTGVPMGTQGLSRQDIRFGDIRIAAIPLPNGVRGVAFSRDDVIAGTWAGDIVLNSNYAFTSTSALQVILHELGHVLGFEHLEGVSSVLNPTNTRTTLATVDLQRLRARYGSRDLDRYDRGRGNGTLNRAQALRLGYSQKGTLPVLAFGDLSSPRDVDYFEFRADSKWGNTLSFQLRTRNNSLVSARLKVLDSRGRVLGQATTTWQGTGIARVTVPISRLTGDCYVSVSSLAGEFAVGSYALVATYPATLETPNAMITEMASWNFSHLSQSQARYRFRDGPQAFFFAVDNHTDDTLAQAAILDPLDLPTNANLHRIDASISDEIDLDYYRFEVPGSFDALPLTLTLHSRDAGLLIGQLSLMTDDGLPLPFSILTNGNGLSVIQLDQAPSGTYVVRVASDPQVSNEFQTGNYTLEIRSDRPAVHPESMAIGEAREGTSEFHTIRVARAQMFHFSIEAFVNNNQPDTVIFATLFDERGRRVYQVATRPNDLRSSQSVLLSPGSYSLRIDIVTRRGNSNSRIAYQFWGSPNTDNEGPRLLDPTLSPFPNCDPTSDVYCYPEGRFLDPYIWVDGLAPDLSPPAAPSGPWDSVDRLYWPRYAVA